MASERGPIAPAPTVRSTVQRVFTSGLGWVKPAAATSREVPIIET